MQPIIEPVERKLLLEELTDKNFVRKTNFGNNEIYIFDAINSPNLMKEVGRLRELSFRTAGGGTGEPIDIDEFDTMDSPYHQLIVWSPEEKEIIGGYRYIHLKNVKPDVKGHYHLATSHMFGFTEKFIQNYLPQTIELGRSFVQPKYQPSKDSRKGIFSLDNLWDGLGALIVDYPDVKYFFGKVTLYLSFDQESRDTILYFLLKYFPDEEHLVFPYFPKEIVKDKVALENLFIEPTFQENYKKLIKHIRFRNEQMPPLINAYMNLSPTMKTFGSALNPLFGEVEEIGILVNISDIYPSKKHRHLLSYLKDKE